MSPSSVKKKIVGAIKDLDPTDYADICLFIKTNIGDTRAIVSETPRGTFVNLDLLEDALLEQLDHIISTKLARLRSASGQTMNV